MSEDFDPAEALALLQVQEDRVRVAFDTRLHEQLGAWGVALLVGLGGIWLQVRGQEPYVGPGAASGILFSVLLAAAAAVTAWRTQQATAGIAGASSWQGGLYGAGWALGFVGYFAILGAIARADAPPPAIGVFATCGPLLITGLMYLFGAALWGVRPMAALGAWLVLVASGAGFAGPVGAVLVGAVLGGGGLLVAASWLLMARRRAMT
ncbi:hypothetical protein [Nostocoides veronense]|uniref:Uncharacterized protein n=1 Tax=Nostocoides veronense TaxID=330836 RepID=A0ABP4XQ71_9MICO